MRSVRSPLVEGPTKAPTGTTGPDENTGGGLRRGRTRLLLGSPDPGKTTPTASPARRPLARGDANGEVSALVDVVQATGQRMEGLTAGEVDTVTDRDGSPFLPRHVHDQLRHSEVAKQAAILNALPAHIALLNSQGLIVSVNESWRRFTCRNATQDPGHAIGLNYLEICGGARGEGSSEAHRVSEGVRSVLYGGAKSYSIEYACNSPTEHRCFMLTVTPLADDHPNGAVVMHLDVTAARQTEQSLRASDLLFRQMAQNIRDVFFLIDADSHRMVYLSPAYEEIWGRTRERAYANPDSWTEAIHPDDRASTFEKYKKGMSAGQFQYEYRIVRPDGSIRWIEHRGFPVHDDAGKIVRITGVAEDITERKRAEIRIKRLNRVYAVLTQINGLIVRVQDRGELFREASRIAVEHGEFRMAWIGIVDSEAGLVKPVASAGAVRNFFETAPLMITQKKPGGHGLVGRAIRAMKPVISNDVHSDLRRPMKRELVERGINSFAVIPLLDSKQAMGVLALYATEVGAFDEHEMRLLNDLAGNISLAIDHIDNRERLGYLALHDVLTGLANRSLFLERVAQCMRGALSGGHKLAVLLIDLERFKNINDSLGQAAGDALLRQVADWLTLNVGDANLLARVSADHFAVMVPEIKEEGTLARLVEKAMEAFLNHQFRLNDAVFRIAFKVGVALFPDDGADADTLFKHAEAALKKAKASGDRYLFYTQKMSEAVAGRLTLENQLRQALDKEQFVLHYQPKVNLLSGKLTSAEALIRWNDPRMGLVPPGRFIPILEETGLIYDLGRWALRKAIEDYLRWRRAGLAAVRIAVNVSPLQLRHRGFTADINQAIRVDAHAAAGLELEITESMIMADVGHSIASLQAIRAMGVSIAIDDFGTGFSSLSYLSKLPVDTLNIDRSFVTDMTAGPQGLALVSTIINLAHSLKLKVVAEGIETEEQSRLLRLLNCDEMQGYLFSKPLPSEIFETRFLAPAKILITYDSPDNRSAEGCRFRKPKPAR
ncbi:MAG: sensor domain-containing protein [Burkholderiales bacterium]